MTDVELAELERLADAATPGPWEANSDHHNNVYVDAMNQGELGLKVQLLDLNMQGNEEDAAFIAASRTAIPALLADLREARASLGEARQLLGRARVGASIAQMPGLLADIDAHLGKAG